MNPDTLVAVVNRRVEGIHSIKASADLIVASPDLGRPRTLQVSLIAERPDRARIRGRAGALVSVFDLSTDRDSLRLYLPRDRALLVQGLRGPEALPVVASRELVPALLQERLSRSSAPTDSGFSRIGDGYQVIQLEGEGRGSVRRRLIYDKDLRLVHQTIERESGDRIRTAFIHYLRYRKIDGRWFPSIVRLELPETNERLELRFVGSVSLNAAIDPALFVLSVPPRTRRVAPEELDDSFLGEAPEAPPHR